MDDVPIPGIGLGHGGDHRNVRGVTSEKGRINVGGD
jgi:hypothetical protein